MTAAQVVVADATPLNILVRTGLVGILPQLWDRVFIPPAVESELTHARTPSEVRQWLMARPAWIEVRAPCSTDSSLTRDPGEREAISLALEIKADYILIDEKHARRAAERMNLKVVGTVGVLELAAQRGLIALDSALDRLRATDFYVSEAVVRAVRERAARAKPPDRTDTGSL